ncbi:unnamed protein product [Spirodela intermedia]|uniref:DUF4005 domain-containing protein n=2 Tax=Spirodela intermedia TaxID=51605 RepID=A0A7I8ITJ7_SPIIN|nr:unnamed protein product [Spirodela intermedia]CAA6660875.1 unnamed protein product [Spirodela intermedia]CAA7397233.1 unnamed protein product [Spirodela intermedia]
MKRSPGKWIKTLLFGKKSFKSRSSKGRAAAENAKDLYGAEESPALSVGSPVISEPISVNTDRIVTKAQLENGAQSDVPSGGDDSFPERKDPERGTTVLKESKYPQRSREAQAATKAQSAFRGYLARRAFRALKGIIRLQAVVRGHLVRRQAVATLKCTWGIVRFQTLVRGKRARQVVEFQVKKETLSILLVVKQMGSFGRIRSSLKGKDSVNAVIRKLLSFPTATKPIKIQYPGEDSNSAWSWLERWTFSKFWKSPALQDAIAAPKAKEAASGRPKRSVRRNFGASTQTGSNGSVAADSERPRRSVKKAASSGPQSELEKVKLSLRKVSGACDSGEAENGALKHDLGQDAKNDAGTATDITKLTVQESRNGNGNGGNAEEDAKQFPDQEEVKGGPVGEVIEGQEEGVNAENGDLTSEEKASVEDKRGSKRRASFPARPEHADNGPQRAPVLPSYMAATQSAKAKFCGQDSPRLGSDGVDKAAFTRRHSLPFGRPASLSPRTQRPVQVSCKAGVRGERSLYFLLFLKPIPVAWRR